jgi:hypothetical protein
MTRWRRPGFQADYTVHDDGSSVWVITPAHDRLGSDRVTK